MSQTEFLSLPPSSPAGPGPRAEAQARAELLVFRIGTAEYGIALRCVEGIRHYQAPTRHAHSSAQLLGVADWRDETVPLLDLRCRLEQAAEFDAQTAIIQIGLPDRSVGIIVDRIAGPVALSNPALEPLPPTQAGAAQPHALALTWAGSRPVVLLDIEALLRTDLLMPPPSNALPLRH